MHRSLVAVLLALSLVPSLLVAQTAHTIDAVAPGSRVRITTPGTPPRIATLLAHRADTLVVRWEQSTDSVSLSRQAISRLEVSAGMHRSVLKHGGIGALVGAAGGAIIGAATYSPCTSTDFLGCYLQPESRTQATLVGAGVGGVLGFVVGGLTGLAKRERWQPVSTNAARSAVWIAPSERGAAVRVALRF